MLTVGAVRVRCLEDNGPGLFEELVVDLFDRHTLNFDSRDSAASLCKSSLFFEVEVKQIKKASPMHSRQKIRA